ncbi:Ca2+-transporting ATPase [Leeuwenhoekiella aestuarii]|uniref:Ca2+-transporting ATPase n=1 Tax=Leeuwenhoekiella aestuarii TaxID=2249426 RepID=A0A4Q0NVH7_9FLAO|nr:cation-translocating P-type ATPase [Leeuwenhoekiella aestuarii]RXG11650.1 Ca2+-transporting ATPase [Leeuwenhoekiella aestuarii]RXG15139.1 Ca2+-transporting ATPase [Leeuwenhoekiella aestuarii]
MTAITHFNIKGLTEVQVLEARRNHGGNSLDYKKESGFFAALKSIAKEPMVLLLLATSSIYFISGKTGDGIFMASAILLVVAISLYQNSRSRNALEKLKDLTQPVCKVIRSGDIQEVTSEELVLGDSLMIEEGTAIAADGTIVHSNDFSVDESILTGESLSVYKDKDSDKNEVYRGTTVAGGLAIITITAIGNKTRLGEIGKSLEDIQEEKTPLERQINSFVKKMVIAGVLVFSIVWAINYFQSYSFTSSLIEALTLAMSILPEEIPVAFTTFMALGAWRLMKLGIVVKQMKTVETLGSATKICTDKTGTLTENKMTLAKVFTLVDSKITETAAIASDTEKELVRLSMWASEPIPFDPMEIALHQVYKTTNITDERPDFKLVHEYPLDGKPPMMTHIFEDTSGNRIIAAKGAPEAMLEVSDLTEVQQKQIENALESLTGEGFRVLGVGEADFKGKDYPKRQQDFKFSFKGIIAFYDPPKKNITQVLEDFYSAGIQVKIITGDNATTTGAIAKQVGFKGFEKSISGEALMQLSDAEIQKIVTDTNVFTRMFPEAKLKIIEALKTNKEIVAMIGDGVNDGPALKAAHIGVAMGTKGTEIAKQAASLILKEDDLSKLVDAVAMGRRIYANLKKAIQYIISIHIPIILTVFLPLALGWIYPNIFSPIHIIFLELIMGPTCSIIYENEPIEANSMLEKPRAFTSTFFNMKELATSIIQGVVIAVGSLFVYQYAVWQGYNEALTRTMVFTLLIVANIVLTLVNRSFYYSVLTTLKYKNKLVPLIIAITIGITVVLLFVKPVTDFFQFERPDFLQILMSCAAGFLSVIWYEAVKWRKRLRE